MFEKALDHLLNYSLVSKRALVRVFAVSPMASLSNEEIDKIFSNISWAIQSPLLLEIQGALANCGIYMISSSNTISNVGDIIPGPPLPKMAPCPIVSYDAAPEYITHLPALPT